MAAVASTTHPSHSSSEYEDAVSWEQIEDTDTLARQTTLDRLSEAFAGLSIGSDIESELRRSPMSQKADIASPEPSKSEPNYGTFTLPPTIKITPPDAVEKGFGMSLKPKL
ncbi:uncharacterized protein BDV14DRAFT_205386 [Aspergillus stella-maris]|uniref:uncharacterized protein n=1 Tax=Aspergillus stella-maris TaxID=1810926 RepID=UPI003CCD8F99